MVKPKPKQLTLLTASIVAAGLFLVQPALALTATAQPYLVTSWESVEAAQPIGQRRCYTDRNGRRVYQPCAPHGYRKPKRKSGHSTTQHSGSNERWGVHEPCANCPSARC